MTALRNELTDEQLVAQAGTGEPERARWSQQELLTATVADAVRRLEYVLLCVNSDKKSKRPEPPEPIRRPGAKPPKKMATLTESSASRLFDLIQGGAA